MDSHSFLNEIRAHGLLSDEQLAAADARFAPDGPHHDLSAALIDQGWLTPFQARQIAAGQAKGLALGQYCLLEELGRGGFGCVYKAVHRIMKRVVAVKVISPELVDDARARAWFRREVLATTQLQHPNIVMAYDANEAGDVLFLVMEYVDGPNLADVVRMQGPLPVGLACTLMYQAARALQYAHEKGMVHRDIKPGNLLLPRVQVAEEASDPGSQPLVKIVDFGLARLQSQGANTLMGFKDKGFLGTPDYVSPEQARNIHDVDIRSDLYSLGCTFFYTLTGRPPFRGKNAVETVLQHLDEEPPRVDALRPEVPQPLASILRRLLAKKPAQRFQTPADLIAELNFFFGSGAVAGSGATAPASAPGLEAGKPRTPSAPVALDLRGTQIPAPAVLTGTPDDILFAGAPADDLPRTTVISEKGGAAAFAAAPVAAAIATPEAPPAQQGATQAAIPAEEERPAPTWVALAPRFTAVWRQWLGVVEEVIDGRHPELSESAYRALHAELVNIARRHAHVPDAPVALKSAETLLAPWLSLHALLATDLPTLASLLQRSWVIERQLGLRRRSRHAGAWAAAAAIFLVAAVLGVLFIRAPSLQTLSPASLWRLALAHPTLALAVAIPPLALGSMHLYARLSRP